MARPKRRRQPGRTAEAQPVDWLPWPAFVGLMGGFLVAYLAVELTLFGRPHPVHWGLAALGGSLGYLGGLVWDRTRGH